MFAIISNAKVDTLPVVQEVTQIDLILLNKFIESSYFQFATTFSEEKFSEKQWFINDFDCHKYLTVKLMFLTF